VLENLVGDLAAGLLERGWKMATAESCTGGWIAKCCTDRAGSSGWFERGLVSYSNEAKQEMLGVSPAVLESDGAVSREVALQMAGGARRVVGVDVAVAVTGIAGPDGGSAEKPVGTVWFGFSTAAATEAELMHFDGGRESIRRQAVAHALRGLAARLEP
jgi:nicotinamide-nucleotide amidase